jgi:hypothetical protein
VSGERGSARMLGCVIIGSIVFWIVLAAYLWQQVSE